MNKKQAKKGCDILDILIKNKYLTTVSNPKLLAHSNGVFSIKVELDIHSVNLFELITNQKIGMEVRG